MFVVPGNSNSARAQNEIVHDKVHAEKDALVPNYPVNFVVNCFETNHFANFVVNYFELPVCSFSASNTTY